MTDEPHDQLPAELLAALRAPAAVDSAVADAHIDGALAHFDAMARGDADAGAGATVTPLRARRQPARWLAAAAAIIVVTGGVWLAARSGGSGPVQSADRAAEAPRSTAAPLSPGAAKSTASPENPPSAAQGLSSNSPVAAPFGTTDTTTAPSSPSPSGGAAAGVGGSRSPLPDSSDQAAIADQLATTTTAPTTSCRAPRLRSALISIATTTVRGQPRLVYTYVSGPEGQIITRVVLDPTTCARS